MNAKKIVEAVEESPLSLGYFLFGFFSIILLRTLFEGLLEVQKSVVPFELFVHYSVFYCSLFLSYVLALKLLAGQKIEKTSRAVLCFWWLLLIVPFVDLIASLGNGFHLTYLWGNPDFILANFFTYGFYAAGTSIGQKLVVMLAVVLSCCYVWIKTRSALRAILSGLAIYFITAFYSTLPSLLLIFANGSFSQELIPDAMALSPVLFLAMAALQLFAWLFFFEKKKPMAILKNLQLLRLAHYFLMALLGLLIFQSIYSAQASLFNFSALLASGFFAFQASVALNDISDAGIDKKSSKRTLLVLNAFSPREMCWLALLESAIALLFALLVSFPVFVLVLGMLMLSWIYSMPPLRAKRFPLLSTLVLALISLLAVYSGFFAAGAASLEQFPLNYTLLVLIFVSLGFNAKDLKDTKADKEAGVKSLPVLLGEEKARKAISLLISIAYVSAFIFTWEILLLPFSLFFALLSDFLLRKAMVKELPLLLAYLCFSLIFAWIVFL